MRLPVLLLIFSYLLIIATDALILYDFRVMSVFDKYRPKRKRKGNWWKVYCVFSILILAVFTVAICLPRREGGSEIIHIMWLLYIVISVLVAQIVYCLFSILGFLPKIFRRRRWNTGLWVGLPLAVLFFVMMWWGTIFGRNKIDVVDVAVTSSSLPASFNGYKIAQISDLHVGTWGTDTSFVSKLVDSVNSQTPDLIVFTGDIVNRKTSEIEPFLKVLSRLHARDGVYSILGNHDYGDYIDWANPDEKEENLRLLKSYQKAMGWKMLNNEFKTIKNSADDSIILIGVENWGEPPFSRYGDLQKAYPIEKMNDSNFKILLSHNPEHWNREVSEISNIDITLSGHTHAMQFMLGAGGWRWSPAKYKYDQWGGLYSKKNNQGKDTQIYVNIGAGEVGMPMRVGATPEITLITLHKSGS